MDSSYDELVTLLSNGISQRKLYFSGHPRVLACSRDFTDKLNALLKADRRESFFLGVVDGNLVHNGRYLVGPTIVGRRLVSYAEDLRCGGFLFRGGIESHEVNEFLGLSVDLSEAVQNLMEARGMMNARGIRNIEISPVYEDPGWFGQFLFEGTESGGGNFSGQSDLDTAIPVYQSLFNTVEEVHGRAGGDRRLDIDGARSVTEKMLQSVRGDFMDIMQLVRYPDYDSYTVGHSVRVAMISVLVGHSLGMNQELLLEVGTAGLLHDVGKVKIPEEILYKPGGLDDEERQIIESHPRLGAQVLLENRNAGPLAIAAAWGHHIRHDRGGYPSPASWAVTDRVTALMHVCDVFEALTAMRPYKEAMTPRRAYEIMLKDRGAFDPGALTAFVSAMGLYPPGRRVRLSSGEEGIVVAAGSDMERPKVRITHGDCGADRYSEEGRVLDLDSEEGHGITVTGLLSDGR